MIKNTQAQQVVDALRQNGGYAKLTELNRLVDVSQWKTTTPFASIRRIVQQTNGIFKIRSGLWALEENKEEVLAKFGLETKGKDKEELFSHYYYQGIIAEIGNSKGFNTYVPPQDKNRKAISDALLKDIAKTTVIPSFSYEKITKRAAPVDVIWFNERGMPDSFFEVEHTPDMKKSLLNFMELRDFYADFVIVGDKSSERKFNDEMSRSAFADLLNNKRVKFRSYDKIDGQYNSLAMQIL